VTLEDRAVAALLEWLSRSETRPGEPVPLRRISAQLGMSRTPVRTAIGRLHEQGLVAYNPRLGFTVATPTVGDLRELFEIRLMIEENGLRRFFDEGKTVSVDRVVELAQATEEFADAAFHQALVDLAQSRRLSGMYGQLHVRIHVTRAGWQANWEPSRFARSASEHRAIARAIREGDRSAALDHLRSHIRRVQEMVINSATIGQSPTAWPRG
jgi:DNA-binding GntR family transcriptional regulator